MNRLTFQKKSNIWEYLSETVVIRVASSLPPNFTFDSLPFIFTIKTYSRGNQEMHGYTKWIKYQRKLPLKSEYTVSFYIPPSILNEVSKLFSIVAFFFK